MPTFTTILLVAVMGAWASAGVRQLPPSRTGPALPRPEIVQIGAGASAATATFLPNCRILATLRELLETRRQRPGVVTLHDVDFTGERFPFRTAPLPELGGQSATGSMVVIGHGPLTNSQTNQNAGDVWVIGLDEQCLSDKYKLGHILLGRAHSWYFIRSWEFTTVPYNQPAPGAPCRVFDVDSRFWGYGRDEHTFNETGWVLTDCRVPEDGFGQVLVRPLLMDDEPVPGPNGRPYLVAFGLVTGIETNVVTSVDPGRVTIKTITESGSGSKATVQARVIAFSDAVRAKMKPYLDGPARPTPGEK